MGRKASSGDTEPQAAAPPPAAPSAFLRTAFTLFTGLLVLTAAAAVTLSIYGSRLEETVVYRNLSEILPPVMNVWLISGMLAVTAAFLFHAFAFGVKFRTIEYVSRSEWRRRIAVGSASILFLMSILVVFAVEYIPAIRDSGVASFLAEGANIWFASILSAIALGLMYVAVVPRKLTSVIPVNIITRLAAFGGAVLFVLMLLAVAEASQPVAQLVAAPDPSGRRPPSTHSISAVLDGLPQRIDSINDNMVTLRFRLTPFNPRETAPRYPVSLDPTNQYSASISVESTGFEISTRSEELSRLQPVAVGEPLTWTWIVAPKAERAGSEQMMMVRLFLHDRATGQRIYTAPVITHLVEVRAPLGLPAWVLSPGTTVGAILVAALSLIGNFLFSRMFDRDRKARD